jgi:hypothetical protein
MPKISPAEYHALPLRVHTFLKDVPLHDVWAVDLPGRREGVTLRELHRRVLRGLDGRLPAPARALFAVRFFLGRIFRLEERPKQASATAFANRLTEEDRARSSEAAGTPDGLFSVVYRFENEQLVELQNRTVHAALSTALVETGDGYRLYLAIYVCKGGSIAPLYMALIDPFRRWVVYPAMLESIRRAWEIKPERTST